MHRGHYCICLLIIMISKNIVLQCIFCLCQREELISVLDPISASAITKRLHLVSFCPHLSTIERNTHSLSHTADCSLTGTIGSVVGAGKEMPGRPLGVWLLLVCVSLYVCVDMGDNSATCPELPSFHWEQCVKERGQQWHTHAQTTHTQTQHRYHTEPYADPSHTAAIPANQLLEGLSHTCTHAHTNTQKQ